MTSAVSLTSTILPNSKKAVIATTPYDPRFPSIARQLGGVWDPSAKTWTFDALETERVRSSIFQIYGIDPLDPTPPKLVSVQLKLDTVALPSRNELFLFNRTLLKRNGRDEQVRFGQGVILIEGDFASSGGSAKYPALAPLKGTVIEVRDVPLPLAESEQKRLGEDIVSILNSDSSMDKNQESVFQTNIAEIRALLARAYAASEFAIMAATDEKQKELLEEFQETLVSAVDEINAV